LEERKSKYNGQLKVIRTLGLGTYIQAGHLTQSGGIIESMWRSTLRKVKGERQEVKDCLILGLGGGTIVKQITKNWPEAKIIGVDIDSDIVELGQKYLKSDFSNVDIKIEDALTISKRLKIKGKGFDLIIVDLYNGDQFPKKFETDKFIHLVRLNLSRLGIAVFNRLYYKQKKLEAEKFGEKLEKVFKNVETYEPLVNLMFVCRF
jgi:spermidine synthase